MTDIDITNIIKSELTESPVDNWHGISKENIEKFLITPTQKQYVDSWTDEIVSKWLVLDEMPGDLIKGYQIVFDSDKKYFGLATKGSKNSDEIGTFIGYCGTFVETLNGM